MKSRDQLQLSSINMIELWDDQLTRNQGDVALLEVEFKFWGYFLVLGLD